MSIELSTNREVHGTDDAGASNRPASRPVLKPPASRGISALWSSVFGPPRRRVPPARPTAPDPEVRSQSSYQVGDGLCGMTRRLIASDRYGFVLLKEAIGQVSEDDARQAWQALNSQMALIPAGNVPLILCDGNLASVDLEAFYLDRHAVTNRQYQKFVQAGGYDDLQIWPTEVWPSVARFTDRSGQPGPRDWENGKFPASKAEHPVVGVCWYEAVAFARWVGKRLPTAAEWQKAGGWPEQLSGGMCNRYPWGNMFEPARVNLSSSGIGQTVPVRDYPNGATPNGIFQMSGNVWEWLSDPLDTIPCQAGEFFQPWKPMRRIIGGAFNTHFPNEATCQYITGQGELDRRDNIGFRCALSLNQLRPLP